MSRDFEEKMNTLIPMVVEQQAREKSLRHIFSSFKRENSFSSWTC